MLLALDTVLERVGPLPCNPMVNESALQCLDGANPGHIHTAAGRLGVIIPPVHNDGGVSGRQKAAATVTRTCKSCTVAGLAWGDR